MGLRERRLRRSMQDPVRGEFRPTGSYFPHPGRTPPQEMLTGVVTGPGVGPVAGEALNDLRHGRGIGRAVLPVLVDRSDPSRMMVLWDELAPYDDRAVAREQAQRAAQQQAAGGAVPGAPGVSGVSGVPGVTDFTGVAADDVPRIDVHVVVDGTSAFAAQPATAVIRGISEVALPPEALPTPTASMCLLDLEVRPPSGAPYSARLRQGFRTAERRASIAWVGATIPVLVDPADPQRIALDLATFDAGGTTPV